MTTAAAPNPELVFDTLFAYQRTAALRAAIDVGVFRVLGGGPADAPSLARACAASERGIRILCDFLTTLNLLEKTNGRYSHSPTSAVFLDPQSPACLAATAAFLGNPAMQQPFMQFTDIVRSGTTVLPGQGTVEPENPVWVQFAHSMAPMMGPMAGPLAAIALDGLNGPVRVLDIAAGHGLFGIEIARQHPAAHVTAVDWPAVLEVALDNARRAGVDQRYTLKPGSAFDVVLDGPYDIVLLTNFLHHFDRPTCVGLLRKMRAAMPLGARVAALEFVPNDDRVTPPMAARFSLTMLASTPSGDAYTLKDLDGMYREAGFGEAIGHAVPNGPETVVVGRAV